jgi:6-phosphogluconolactonase (cycloisomerase 2 family)
VSIFPVDASTGAAGTQTTVSGPQTSFGMAALNNNFLYASDLQGTGNVGSVHAWSIDPTTGALTPVSGSPFSLGPLSLAGSIAANNNSQVLYVADVARIDALKADATGALTPIAGSPFASGVTLYLAIDPMNRFLFADDHELTDSIDAFAIDPTTGGLTPVPGSPFPIASVGTNSLLIGIVVDGSGSFVYTIVQSTNQVAAFSIAPATGALTAVPGSPFTVGNLPLALTTVNKFLYVTNAGDGTLSGFSIDSNSGALTPLAGSPFPIHAGALTADPARGFLYTAGPLGLMSFKIDSTTGALTQLGTPPPMGPATVLTFVQ